MGASPAGTAGDAATAAAYRLKVALAEIRPEIWRRLEISGAMSLKQLHLAIQAAMGWQNYHLYSFEIDGIEYGEPDPELPCKRAGAASIGQVLPAAGARCTYLYDFGDDWRHTITVETVTPGGSPERVTCLDGGRACPPEDCGGAYGYVRLLEALADPRDEEHDQMVQWTGGHFDPDRFDPVEANARLEREPSLRPRRPKGPGAGKGKSRAAKAETVPPPSGGTADWVVGLVDRLTTRAEARGRSHGLLVVLRERFGAVPRDVAARIGAEDDLDVLAQWTVTALRAASLADFAREVGP